MPLQEIIDYAMLAMRSIYQPTCEATSLNNITNDDRQILTLAQRRRQLTQTLTTALTTRPLSDPAHRGSNIPTCSSRDL
jgi:hypothetical protein